MSEKEKNKDLDIAGLLALKAFERPTDERIEKGVQNTMRAVREEHAKPSLLHFPDKSSAWMFAQPRYGIAALFILFLGLHLLERPMPSALPASAGFVPDDTSYAQIAAQKALESTNSTSTIPGIKPAHSRLAVSAADSAR
jgi:hypothetical protein